MTKSRLSIKLLQLFLLIILAVIIFHIARYIIQPFENEPPTTTTKTPITTALPGMDKTSITAAGCPRTDNLVSMCMNYTGCCTSNPTGECYCKHPTILNCKSQYDTCMQNNTNPQECREILQNCCTSYNSINISADNFKQIGTTDQKHNKICSLLGTSNIANKCMELCQTNSDCQGYSVDGLSCNLYSKVDYEVQKSNSGNMKYYKKV